MVGRPCFSTTGIRQKPVLKVLLEQLTETLAHEIGIFHARRDEDLAPRLTDPVVELVVLISHQPLVEQADAIEHPSSERGKLRTFNVPLEARETMPGIAHAERMRHGHGHGFPERGGRSMLDGSAHNPGFRMRRQQRHIRSNEIRRDQRMPVDAYDDVSVGARHGEIQAGRHDATWIVDDKEPRVLCLQGSQDLACAVRRLTVGDDHLEAIGRIVLIEDRADQIGDEHGLIADRYHDAYEGPGIHVLVH